MMHLRAAVLFVLLGVAAIASAASNEAHAGGHSYVVDLTGDVNINMCQPSPGDCTLRGALQNANGIGSPGDSITFDSTVFPPGAPVTIALTGQLPSLSDGNDTIDGTGAGVILDGPNMGPITCFAIGSDNNTVKGLRITDCGSALNVVGSGNVIGPGNNLYGNGSIGATGIRLAGNGNTVKGNFIGTNADGTATGGANTVGIIVDGGTMNNVIGGATAADRNVISGNQTGIVISGANTTVKGNYVGTDVTGMVQLGNSGTGIRDLAASIIGGAAPGEGNIVSGNAGAGIELSQFSGMTGAVVYGNLIGTAVNATTTMGNGSHGIHISGAPVGVGKTIGGLAPGQGNVIAFNGGDGVFVGQGTGVTIRGNAIHSNTGLGIDISPDGLTANDGPGDADTGVNTLQNFPGITGAARVSRPTTTPDPFVHLEIVLNVQGTLVSSFSATFELDFYGSPSCDGSGNGEGAEYLSSTQVITSGSPTGSAAFGIDLPVDSIHAFVTATATSVAGNNTSEFSACFHVDSDADGDFDEADNCPNWANPAQSLPTWNVPAGDSDCDGFTDARETYLTTEPALHCAATTAQGDEFQFPDRWPFDINDNRVANTVDLGSWVGKLGLDSSEVGWTPRLDLNQSPNGIINTVDVGMYVGRLGNVCSPAGS